MKTHIFTAMSALFALCLSGCAGNDSSSDQSQPDIEGEGTKIESKLIASTDLGYGKLEFHSIKTADGHEVIYAVESSSAYISHTPIDDLVAAEAPTNLELFLAVSPDQTPPRELVDSHPNEVSNRQRKDDSIRTIPFDRDAPVEKSTTSCNNWQYILPTAPAPDRYTDGVRTALNYQSGSVWMPLGRNTGDWGYYTMNNVSLGVCNDSTNESANMGFAWEIDSTGWQYSGNTVIPPGGQAKQFNFSTAYWSGLTRHPARYAINGWLPTQANYHLRAIEFVYVPYLI
jgi:hypothetical protein